MTTSPRRSVWSGIVPPLLIGIVALGLLLTALLMPAYGIPRSGQIDLHPGTSGELAFKSQWRGQHYVSLTMDQPTMRRLYPCVVDDETWEQPQCQDAGLPLDLTVALRLNGRPGSETRFSGRNMKGGSYGGRETFSVLVAAWDLDANRDYSVVVRSNADGSGLAPARPVIEVDIEPGKRASDMIVRLLLMALSAVLGLVALGWALVVFVVRLRRPPPG